ncbi:unnamed protein product [Closterium sp. Naga37s-1]|nr:unnamed protein product [Closterium sp. Naga37s-1]
MIPLSPLACAQPAPSVWHCSGEPASPPLPAAPLAALLVVASAGTAGGATAGGAIAGGATAGGATTGGSTASGTPASGTSDIGFSAPVVASRSSSIGALSQSKAFYAGVQSGRNMCPLGAHACALPHCSSPTGRSSQGRRHRLCLLPVSDCCPSTWVPVCPLHVGACLSPPIGCLSVPSTWVPICLLQSGTAMAALVSPAAKAVAALPALPAGQSSACVVGVSVGGGVAATQVAQGALVRVVEHVR